ncbi:hypothetical protein B7R54_06025 [Subtercola boreus]|uniref:DUF4190 domain-containing protein n=1 Tax=Subtercola boreus TaxID=120213 RepID=A0A3E0VGH5_9MICO|nr:DUF4190 domain-containing protein [Subtercola boreus]RFA08831.1 hypothetical protein B7R54_06025 [Subtercola boreus]TQL54199.1 uncharacterized protein DUF4190 [Subtercola boreus]
MSDQNPYNAPEQPKYGEAAPTEQYPQPAQYPHAAQYTQPTEQYPQPSAQQQYDPYAVPPPQAYGQRTNTLAIIALVLGLTIPIGGIVTGHIALAQIRRTGEAGRGLALAGLIIGYAYTALVILAILAYVIFIVVLVGAAGMSHSTGYNFNT